MFPDTGRKVFADQTHNREKDSSGIIDSCSVVSTAHCPPNCKDQQS